MSADRRKDNHAPTRPLMPRLAASATSTRLSPAPRLAGYTAPTNSSGVKRSLATDTPPSLRSAEAKQTPIKAFVSPNVTPRSSSRRSRTDSAHSTPTADGTPTRPKSMLAASPLHPHSIGDRSESDLNRLRGATTSPPHPAVSLPTTPWVTQSPEVIAEDAASQENGAGNYFFHADEAPPANKQTRPKYTHKKSESVSSFLQTNGDRGSSMVSTQSSRKPAIDGDSVLSTSFFRADSAPASAAASSVGKLESAPKPAALPIIVPPARSPVIRPPSPERANFHLTYRKGASQIIRPSPLSPQFPSPENSPHRRQSSLDSDTVRRRSRTLSISSGGSVPETINQSVRSNPTLQMLSKFALPTSKASPLISPIERDETTSDVQVDRMQSPSSSTIASGSGDGRSGDAAANARRERKVLDLEISNSSLLAINKSLEREVRKQKAELRRFKRMSRATARSSLLSETATDNGLGRLTEDENEDEAEESSAESSLDDEDDEDEPSSPGALAESDAKHQAADQRRMRLDLAKHKELLADSTRMNQSLRRCLGVTEQLIRDGTRALAYRVKTSDVHLGGRVLSPEEQEGHDDSEIHEGSYFGAWKEGDSGLARDSSPAPDVNEVLGALDDAEAAGGLDAPRKSSAFSTLSGEMGLNAS